MATLREMFYPTTVPTIELRRNKDGYIYALGGEHWKHYPHSILSEDGKRVLGKVLWNSSLSPNDFWRVYGDGINDCVEKVNGKWVFFENAHLIPDHISIVAIDGEEASSYLSEALQVFHVPSIEELDEGRGQIYDPSVDEELKRKAQKEQELKQLDADLRAALGDKYYHARQFLLSGLSCYFNDSPRRLLAGFRHQCTAYDYEIKKLGRDRDTLHLRYSLDLVEIFQVLENFRPALEQLDLPQTCGEFAGLKLDRYLADAPADLSEKILAELAKPE